MTTRTLFVLRHARAASPLPGQRDYDRPLDTVGWEDGKALGRLLSRRETRVTRLVTSGALRTMQTCEALAAGGFALDPIIDDDLYHGKAEAYRAAAERYGADDLMIVGHNPMISDFVQALVRHAGASGGIPRGLRKCAVAILTQDAAASSGPVLKELIEPPFSA